METMPSRIPESKLEIPQARIPHYKTTHPDQFSPLSAILFLLLLWQDCSRGLLASTRSLSSSLTIAWKTIIRAVWSCALVEVALASISTFAPSILYHSMNARALTLFPSARVRAERFLLWSLRSQPLNGLRQALSHRFSRSYCESILFSLAAEN